MIDLSINNVFYHKTNPMMTITRNGITISKEAAILLGCPEYVGIYLYEGYMYIASQKANTPGSVKFYSDRGPIKYVNKTLLLSVKEIIKGDLLINSFQVRATKDIATIKDGDGNIIEVGVPCLIFDLKRHSIAISTNFGEDMGYGEPY